MIQAIETRYKRCRFRSRLEARWAVFFDAFGAPWEYEKEGYNLGPLGLYLPDFWLPKKEWGIWIEIKGQKPTDTEVLKVRALAAGTDHPAILVWGSVSEEHYAVISSKGEWDGHTGNSTDTFALWCQLLGCKYWWAIKGKSIEDYYEHARTCPLLWNCYAAARSARFEYGEMT